MENQRRWLSMWLTNGMIVRINEKRYCRARFLFSTFSRFSAYLFFSLWRYPTTSVTLSSISFSSSIKRLWLSDKRLKHHRTRIIQGQQRRRRQKLKKRPTFLLSFLSSQATAFDPLWLNKQPMIDQDWLLTEKSNDRLVRNRFPNQSRVNCHFSLPISNGQGKDDF